MPATIPAAELAGRLARDAEAVCRHYLSNGCRQGRYWLVGDVLNSPGRSLYVRLTGPSAGKGAAGKWTDAATGEHGDLLDLIRRNRGHDRLRDALHEARAFLSLPRPEPPRPRPPAPQGSPEAARRLFARAGPLAGTPAVAYLRGRGVTARLDAMPALRFHPACFYREREEVPGEAWPALLAAVTDPEGTVTGVHRTWLDRDGAGKAPVGSPRRAMGHLLGNAVRFGGTAAPGVLAAGEGIETMLSLASVLPGLPLTAALSANHLAALVLPPMLRRLYVARDNDAAGRHATVQLRERAHAAGVEVRVLRPALNDFNADLRAFGADALLARVRDQLAPEDARRFAP